MESPDPFINLLLIILLEVMLSINIHFYVCQRDTHYSSCSNVTVAYHGQNSCIRAL